MDDRLILLSTDSILYRKRILFEKRKERKKINK